MASKPKRVEVYKATTRPRRASGALLCRMMLVPTLLMVMPKPSSAMAISDSQSSVLLASISMARALMAIEARIRPGRVAVVFLPASNMLEPSEPRPAAPHSQPRVVASPPKISRAKTGSSTT